MKVDSFNFEDEKSDNEVDIMTYMEMNKKIIDDMQKAASQVSEVAVKTY